MSDELKWSPITITFPPEDLAFLETRNDTLDLILGHYRLPPSLLLNDAGPSPLAGFTKGSNRTPPIKRTFF